jgi:hypothetical protein
MQCSIHRIQRIAQIAYRGGLVSGAAAAVVAQTCGARRGEGEGEGEPLLFNESEEGADKEGAKVILGPVMLK